MYVRYGNYSHADNECAVIIGSRHDRTVAGHRKSTVKTYVLRGRLHGSSPSDLTNKIAALEAAYSTDFQSLILYDGAAPTAHLLDNASSISGVRVVSGPNYPEGDDAQYTTFRDFEITLEAEYPASPGVGLLAWSETLSFVGTGGPMTVHVPTVFGPPQKQITSAMTPVQVVQSGQAVGWSTWPVAPPPLWPAAEVLPRRRFNMAAPKWNGQAFTEFPIMWSYEFESAVPLSGLPTPQPNP